MIQSLPFVKEVAILVNAETTLTAYIVPQEETYPSEEITQAIKAHLRTTSLPVIAYPKIYIHLPELPLTPNGKINTKELANLNYDSNISLTIKLSSPLQQQLREIWADVLGIPEELISPDQPFKELGGDSLSLSRLERLLNEKFTLPHNASMKIFSKDMSIQSLEKNIQPFLKKKNEVKLSNNTVLTNSKFIVFPKREPKPNTMPPAKETNLESNNKYF
jgi:hypothetical protein